MGRKKSVFNTGDVPKFKYYKNRKTYFSNASKYVTHEETREIVASSGDLYEVEGIKKENFLLKILTIDKVAPEDIALLFRVVCGGGFLKYIRTLESHMVGTDHMMVTPVDAVNSLNFDL